MQARMAISCGEHVAFVLTHGHAGPSALRHPLWLRLPANENLPAAGKFRLHVIENPIPRSLRATNDSDFHSQLA